MKELKQLAGALGFIFLLAAAFILSSCSKDGTVTWPDCSHFARPAHYVQEEEYLGVGIILTPESRYEIPCDCHEEDYGDWNKITGVKTGINAQVNSVLLGWRYDGVHYLAPYIHDDAVGEELNPDFCGQVIIPVRENYEYLFLVHKVSRDTLVYAIIGADVYYVDTLTQVVEFDCRRAYFDFKGPLIMVNSYFGGQCKSPGGSFWRRILKSSEVKKYL